MMARFSPCVLHTPLPLPARQSTAMTIAMVGASETRMRTADVVARVAGLAVTDELVVVYGSDERQPRPGVQPFVVALRRLLPRHAIVAPETAIPEVATELFDHLRADRVQRLVGTSTRARSAA
jgi:hypothetical protein